ncbi:protein sprouty [Diachasma alloeum]|uniref:protein sprouty n=1 Tax=Diachasma alloeum TaxID=454923 RepID=UPI0007381CB0|nr:protein sprouty [Diachasma alloeum]XP_015110510.1 protein sprouty [Diachasma alloeum]
MSTNGQNSPSRPASSASSGSSTSNLPRVHGHDHTRPLPPPRLEQMPAVSTIAVPLTSPLPPLSASSSFRSRLPLTNSLSDSLSSPRGSERSQVGEVTLTVPRPDGERAVNEYVETPFRQAHTTNPSQKCMKTERRHHHLAHHHKSDSRLPRRHQQTLLQSSPSAPVTKQPVSFTKEPANTIGTGSIGPRSNDPSLSIMCDYCGKCRCESCREPPPLPSRWLCDNTCFCSAETALDYASCLCCVKGLFYHCGDTGSGGDSEAGGSCADEPCSCSGSRKGARWACLAALTMVLPCLLCYWPLKGCVTICEACYARHAAQGCRCDPNARHNDNEIVVTRDSRDPEKRLLDPVTPEL